MIGSATTTHESKPKPIVTIVLSMNPAASGPRRRMWMSTANPAPNSG